MPGRISIGSSAFAIGQYEKSPIPFDAVIKRLSNVGYNGVELFGARPYGHPSDFASKASRRELRKKFDDLNLEVSNYGADFWGIALGAGEVDAQRYRDHFKRNLEFCIEVGSDSLRVDTVSAHYPEVDRVTLWQRYVTTWRACAEWAATAGVAVYWEFEPGFIVNKPSEIARLVDDVGAPNFKLMFDTCHAQMSGVQAARQEPPREAVESVPDLIAMMGHRIGTVHLIDSDNTLHHETTSTHAPFGDGVLDFDAIIRAFQAVGYHGPWWTIDLCFWPTAWDIVESSYHFVRDLMTRHGLC